ncbi:hypothetical protein [Bacillus sp. m3-13]|uniref:hypothetical protein n=1 Tax=Bacillus sp. m3-13 TaxID=406124 RepID=UPI0001E89D49|nr:hypothetical protein [Bacillus sp. m3-13]
MSGFVINKTLRGAQHTVDSVKGEILTYLEDKYQTVIKNEDDKAIKVALTPLHSAKFSKSEGSILIKKQDDRVKVSFKGKHKMAARTIVGFCCSALLVPAGGLGIALLIMWIFIYTKSTKTNEGLIKEVFEEAAEELNHK